MNCRIMCTEKAFKPREPAENSVYGDNDVCKDIKCDYDATCEIGTDRFPRCSCIFNCSDTDMSPVCGSDFRAYNSLCLMKMEGCQRQQELRLRPMELCQGMCGLGSFLARDHRAPLSVFRQIASRPNLQPNQNNCRQP